MTQRQAALTSAGEYIQRKEGYEKKEQLEWERSRWMAYSIFSPFITKNKPTSPRAWVKFPWEHTVKGKMIEIKEQEIITLDNIYKDFMSKQK